MANDDLQAAVRALRTARAGVHRAERRAERIVATARERADQARAELARAIIAADQRGVRQRDIVAETGYSRERVRQIIRSAG